MNGLERDFGSFGDDGDDGLSGLASSAMSDATSAASGLGSTATSAVGDAVGAVGGGSAGALAGSLAGSAVATGTSAAQAALSGVAGNILTTVEGAMSAAGGIESSIAGGDYVSAGAQALQVVQQAAAASTGGEAAVKAGLAMSAKFAAAGAAIGTVVPVIGNVIGAVVGAIIGFAAGVGQSLAGNLAPQGAQVNTAQNLQKLYNAAQAGPTWFQKTPGKEDSITKLTEYLALGEQNNAGIAAQIAATLGLSSPSAPWKPQITRDFFWKTWPDLYKSMQGSGLVSVDFTKQIAGTHDYVDMQPSLDMFMNGVVPHAPADSPTAAIDFALWLCKQPDAGKQILLTCSAELSAVIFPLMPMAIAARVYRSYVPVLSAAGCYSPSAIAAVRTAATSQASKAGPQVAQCVTDSLPNDDMTALLHAYAFLDAYPPNATETTLSNDQKIGVGAPLWSNNSEFRLVLQTDGNLVLYEGADDSNALWSSQTVGSGATSLVAQKDGNVVLYAPGNRSVWATNTAGKTGAKLKVQGDGNLVIYDSNNTAIWDTNTVRTTHFFPILSYMVPRKGIWGNIDSNSPVVKGLTASLSMLIASKTNSLASASAYVAKYNMALPVKLMPNRIATLANAAQSVANGWKKPYIAVDCLKGDNQAQLDQQIGLTAKLGGTGGSAIIHRTPVRTKPVAAKPKSNLTNKHWWIEAVVAALVGIGVYKVVHKGRSAPHA